MKAIHTTTSNRWVKLLSLLTLLLTANLAPAASLIVNGGFEQNGGLGQLGGGIAPPRGGHSRPQ